MIEESENFNAAEIAEEKAHLAQTLANMREQIELLENDGFAYRIIDIYDEQEIEEYRTDKFRHDERQRDIAILKASLSTPYFARMSLKQIGAAIGDDRPSMTRMRSVGELIEPPIEADIYVGAHVVVYKGRIIVYSHNSPLGNRIYDRFENGVIEYGGYTYEVQFRRKFDIRDGELMAVFQDYSKTSGGVVYDKFLAHMLRVRRGDRRLTDIIPTIQANQNAIITRPADENSVVVGCAGCGKTMILLQRLEYLSFNKKLDLDRALVIAPSHKYIEHIKPVVADLMIGAARRLTLAELYRELILSLHGIKSSARRVLSGDVTGDEGIPIPTLKECYGDALKRKLIAALKPTKLAYSARMAEYRDALAAYENASTMSWLSQSPAPEKKPKAPAVGVDLDKYPFVPKLPHGCKARLYLLLTAYCYIIGKPKFDSALFIDEGQEYYLNEYRLLAECTKATVNVYGDENQQIGESGIKSFDELDELWGLSRYALNENYRNSREITEYVNALLGMNVTSLGLDGGSVAELGFDALAQKVKEAMASGDRVAVIYSPDDRVAAEKLAGIPTDVLCTVRESKGLEFERVFACGAMSDREKYVAYTRALNTLFIVK